MRDKTSSKQINGVSTSHETTLRYFFLPKNRSYPVISYSNLEIRATLDNVWLKPVGTALQPKATKPDSSLYSAAFIHPMFGDQNYKEP